MPWSLETPALASYILSSIFPPHEQCLGPFPKDRHLTAAHGKCNLALFIPPTQAVMTSTPVMGQNVDPHTGTVKLFKIHVGMIMPSISFIYKYVYIVLLETQWQKVKFSHGHWHLEMLDIGLQYFIPFVSKQFHACSASALFTSPAKWLTQSSTIHLLRLPSWFNRRGRLSPLSSTVTPILHCDLLVTFGLITWVPDIGTQCSTLSPSQLMEDLPALRGPTTTTTTKNWLNQSQNPDNCVEYSLHPILYGSKGKWQEATEMVRWV